MTRTALRWFAALAVGAVTGAATAWAVGALSLAAAVGLCTAAGALLLLQVRREYPDRLTGDTWADKRWTGLSVGVVTFAALVGPVSVPVGAEYRAVLQLLVVLTGFVGYAAGSLTGMDRESGRAGDTDEPVAPTDH